MLLLIYLVPLHYTLEFVNNLPYASASVNGITRMHAVHSVTLGFMGCIAPSLPCRALKHVANIAYWCHVEQQGVSGITAHCHTSFMGCIAHVGLSEMFVWYCVVVSR